MSQVKTLKLLGGKKIGGHLYILKLRDKFDYCKCLFIKRYHKKNGKMSHILRELAKNQYPEYVMNSFK